MQPLICCSTTKGRPEKGLNVAVVSVYSLYGWICVSLGCFDKKLFVRPSVRVTRSRPDVNCSLLFTQWTWPSVRLNVIPANDLLLSNTLTKLTDSSPRGAVKMLVHEVWMSQKAHSVTRNYYLFSTPAALANIWIYIYE